MTNIVFSVSAMIMVLSALIGMGAVLRFSILLSKDEKDDTADLLGNAIALMVWLGTAISACASVFLKLIFCITRSCRRRLSNR